ncbi:helix-turn-helix transcriptional regulator [Paradevosia shaoguanensis]|uniref:YafY family transcriptional regulator n=1 Tax=Paradevosia shaoguanensis TaxID=1335043 RepID=A0AA41UCV2_9HYPH|nr:YafY family protein [Paradevosia shaoguanensis]MCF1744154.1 YafY family transcriptional regulator [Paradevosia shaoguanensis]MCI0128637.1 YafY family transcriptional regulator [Paradevosia shaoguanensis]
MRASRLLSIMMMLQSRGRLSAETLAEELEVSMRTIYRDIDQLSAAGVPVYAETGRNGGFALLDGWRTRLTGLTAPEAKALFLSGLPGPAAELGLSDDMAAAELKLLAALPADWQDEARRISGRFHLDPKGWFQPGRVHEHLKSVADAVWSERRIHVRYESWTGVSDRVLEPLGLVLKGGIWYVVARREGAIRTYRLSNILALIMTEERFERPDDFDLPGHWEQATLQFEKDIYVDTALVRASEVGRKRLLDVSQVVRSAVEAAQIEPDAEGWATLTIPIEEIGWAAREMTKIGCEIVVLEPPELRSRMAEMARKLWALYAG